MSSNLQVSKEHLNIIKSLIKEYVPDYKVVAFGSRVSGTPKPYSDLDLAIIYDEPLDAMLLAKLRLALEESDLPYKVDIVEYVLVSDAFKEVIDSDNLDLDG